MRSFAAAKAQAGEPWPDILAYGQGPAPDTADIDLIVLAGLGAGFLEASDLRGPVRTLARHIARAQAPELSDLERAVRIACPDVVELRQMMARAAIEDRRFQALMERRRDRGDDTQESIARHSARMTRVRDEARRLVAAIEAKVAAAR